MAGTATKRAAASKPGQYESADIQVLEGVEHVRLRPGMYIGTTSSRGLHHLVYEVVDNSIDEAMAGHSDRIIVRLRKDGSCEVEDDGRGIPIKPIPKAKDRRPAVEVVLTTLNAGGKFGGEGYRISGGLHGVGVSVVNALSEKLTVQVMRDGSTWSQTYARGKATSKLTKGKPTRKNGTVITFWPDPEVFEEGVEFDARMLAERLQEHAFLTKGVEIQLVDEREGKPTKQIVQGIGRDRRLRQAPRHGQGPDPQPRHLDGGARGRRRGRRLVAVDGCVLGVDPLVREHDQHARGRHARRGAEEVAHQRDQPLRAQQEA